MGSVQWSEAQLAVHYKPPRKHIMKAFVATLASLAGAQASHGHGHVAAPAWTGYAGLAAAPGLAAHAAAGPTIQGHVLPAAHIAANGHIAGAVAPIAGGVIAGGAIAGGARAAPAIAGGVIAGVATKAFIMCFLGGL